MPRFLLLSALALVCLPFVGCGDSPPPPPAPTAAPTATTDAAPAKPGKGVRTGNATKNALEP